MTEESPDELSAALTAFLHSAAALAAVAQEGMPVAQLRELSHAVDIGRAQIACTMLLPSGGVRIGVVGEWAHERCLWQMTPNEPVLRRATQ